MDDYIQIQGITKIFEKPHSIALHNIHANVKSGRITGLVGPDGAGKTTLIRLITGLMQPTSGKISVCGFDTQTEQSQIQNIIGYMPQKFGLYEDLTVIENLELYAKLQSIPLSEKEAIFQRMLAFTDLDRFIHRQAGRLSGGMKQKLGLACSLLSHPKVLLLDEPSVGVDPISRKELWKMVQNLVKEGLAVIWATSYLDEAERCHEVILLNEGKVLFDGQPEILSQRVNGRVFLVTPNPLELRTTLAQYLKHPDVIDTVIQAQNIRVILKPQTKPFFELPYQLTTPRFEDAFIDILEGKFHRESILAKYMHTILPQEQPPIEAINLTKQFGDFIAAKNISFKIKRGEIFGLLGPNGAGKSTTFKMMCGILQPTQGQALIGGIDLKTLSVQARTKIGYMAQKFSLYSDLSVKQNLDFFSGVYGLKNKARKQKIDHMIDIFDLNKYLDVNAGVLPLGYKQRLALSCSVMHEPDVLFLDEPTSGVDPLTRREFWTHINAMVLKGVTIMVTTHFMDEAQYCDRIALIYRGVSIATGTPENLKQRIQSPEFPNPSLEDAFIALVSQYETKAQEQVTV